MSCLVSSGWQGIVAIACFYIGGFCIGVILALAYWRTRYKILWKALEGLRAQQELVNRFHTGEIDRDELERLLITLYSGWETRH